MVQNYEWISGYGCSKYRLLGIEITIFKTYEFLLMNEQERSIFQVGDELWQKKGGPRDPTGFSLR